MVAIDGSRMKSPQFVQDAKQRAIRYYADRTKSLDYNEDDKQNAAIVILCRNEDLEDLSKTLSNFEKRFNSQFKYPYILVNDKPFTAKFEKAIRRLIAKGSGAQVKFGLVPREHWSYPAWIDQAKAADARKAMSNVMYGGSESYRFMCRYYSGFFFDHPLLRDYKYYWRIEPGVSYLCNIPFDPFLTLEREKKKYGMIISFPELEATVPTLMNTTLAFQKAHPELLQPDSWFKHFQNAEGQFNLCHWWSNFEIGSLDFFRSPAYRAYFEFLDRSGGFFYERWGDAPVHSFATGMFLKYEEMHYFKEIGYRHPPIISCPVDAGWRKDQDCDCDPADGWDRGNEWCIKSWQELGVKRQLGA